MESSRIIKFGENIPRTARLVALNNPQHDNKAWRQVSPAYHYQATMRIDKGTTSTYTQSMPDKDRTGGYLGFCIDSSGIAPQIRLTYTLRPKEKRVMTVEEDEAIDHYGWVEFSFSDTVHEDDNESRWRSEISDIEFSCPLDQKYAELSFTTQGGRASNIKCLTDFSAHDGVTRQHFDPLERQMIEMLASLARPSNRDTYRVVLSLCLRPLERGACAQGNRTEIDDLADLLPHLNNPRPDKAFVDVHYKHYRCSNDSVPAEHTRMPTRRQVLSNHPGLPLPAKKLFRDQDEALILLSNGIHLQAEEERVFLRTLSAMPHLVEMYSVGSLAVAKVKYNRELSTGLGENGHQERIVIQEGTTVRLTFVAKTKDTKTEDAKTNAAKTKDAKQKKARDFSALGLVMADTLEIGGDLVLIIKDKTANKFFNIEPLLEMSKNMSRPRTVTLTSEVNETTTATLIDALAKTYDRTRPTEVLSKYPALLNDGAALTQQDTFKEVREQDRSQLHKSSQNLLGYRPWNTSQMNGLKNILHPHGGIALITGCGGSGKTSLMLASMKFGSEVGFKILVTGILNASLDYICKKYASEFPEERPVRVYSTAVDSLSASHLHHTTDDQILLLQLLVEYEKESVNKRRRNPEYSIQGRMHENLQDRSRPALMARFIIGQDEKGEPIYEDDKPVDMRAHARNCFDDLAKHPLSDRRFWNDDSHRRLRQSVALLRQEVLQEAKVLITTSVLSGTKEISQNFAKDGTKILCFDDEAHMMSEPEALVAAARTDFGPQVAGWYMFGDVEQLGVPVISAMGPRNIFNEFQEQLKLSLFERLIGSGHPVRRLTTQNRQHAILFTPINELHYAQSVKTVESRSNPLKDGKDLIGTIVGLSPENLAKQTEEQRRMLCYRVFDAPVMKSGTSRANPGFAYLVCTKILPVLRKTYGKAVSEEVCIITPYRRQVNLYKTEFNKLMLKDGWERSELPVVETVDSIRGQEFPTVILDFVNDKKEGFMFDKKRANVAWSRAKERMILIVGNMEFMSWKEHKQVIKDYDHPDRHVKYFVRTPLAHHMRHYLNHGCEWTFDVDMKKVDVPSDLRHFGPGFAKK